LIEDGTAFLANWGSQASGLGWTALDVFGVHPIAPAARYDCMGLVPLIRGDEVVVVNERCATTRSRGGGLLKYLRRPRTGAVLVWELM